MHDLRRLRAFQAVARTGSFSQAAVELGYAQSVVSHHVAALEREFGLTLINRGTRPVSVTDAGSRLLRHTEMALGHIAAAEDELRAVAGVESGSILLGAFLSASNSFVPDAVARFEAAHPDVRTRLEQIEEPADLRRVRSGDLDLAIAFRVREGTKTEHLPLEDGFDEAHLADDRFLVVLPPAHPLARRRQLTIAELACERFIAPPGGGFQPYGEFLERLCANAEFQPNVTHEVNDVTVARAFVAAGLGIAVLPDLALAPPRQDVAVRPIRGSQPFRSIYATWLRDRRAPAVSTMVRYLASTATARLG